MLFHQIDLDNALQPYILVSGSNRSSILTKISPLPKESTGIFKFTIMLSLSKLPLACTVLIAILIPPIELGDVLESRLPHAFKKSPYATTGSATTRVCILRSVSHIVISRSLLFSDMLTCLHASIMRVLIWVFCQIRVYVVKLCWFSIFCDCISVSRYHQAQNCQGQIRGMISFTSCSKLSRLKVWLFKRVFCIVGMTVN